MATGTYAPDPDLHVVDANGVPVSGGLVWTYIAGTTTPTPTYTDVGLTVPNTNPIVAGSDGRFVAFLTGGISYKFVYEMPAVPPAHGAVLATRDNILAVTTIVPGSGGGITQITGLTGTVNDFPLIPGCSVLYCTNSGVPLTITGLSGGVSGQRLTIIALGAQVNLAPSNSGSLVANRLLNWATAAPTALARSVVTCGSATYIYDGTLINRWELVAHDQGEWITPPFNAADFTATGGGGTWTVASGNIGAMSYKLTGRMIFIVFQILTTTVGGAPTALNIFNGQFGGHKLLTNAYFAIGFTTDSAGFPYVAIPPAGPPGANYLNIMKGSNGTFAAGSLFIYGSWFGEVV